MFILSLARFKRDHNILQAPLKATSPVPTNIKLGATVNNFTRSIIAGVAAGAVSVSALVVPRATAQDATTTDMTLPLACYVQPKGSAAGLRRDINAGNPGFDQLQVSMSATAPSTVEQGQEFDYVIDPGMFSFPKKLSMLGQTFDASFVSQANLWIDLPENVEVVAIDYDKNTPLGFNVIQDGNRIRFVGEERRQDARQVGPTGHNGQPVGDNPAEWIPNRNFFNRKNEERWFYGGAEIKTTVDGGAKLGTPLPKVTLKLKATGEPGATIQASMRKADAKSNNPQAPIQGLVRGVVGGQVINALTRCGLSEDYTGSGSKLPATPFPAVTIVEKKEEETPAPVTTSSSEETTPETTSSEATTSSETPSEEPTTTTSETSSEEPTTTTSETQSEEPTTTTSSSSTEPTSASETTSTTTSETSSEESTTSTSSSEPTSAPESTTTTSSESSSEAPTTTSSLTTQPAPAPESTTTTSSEPTSEVPTTTRSSAEPTPAPETTSTTSTEPSSETTTPTTPSSTTQPAPVPASPSESTTEKPSPSAPTTVTVTKTVTATKTVTTTKAAPTTEPTAPTTESTTPTTESTTTESTTTESTATESTTPTTTSGASGSGQGSGDGSAEGSAKGSSEGSANGSAEGSANGSSEGSAQGSSTPVVRGLLITIGVLAGLVGLVGLGNWLREQGCEFIPEFKLPEIKLPVIKLP